MLIIEDVMRNAGVEAVSRFGIVKFPVKQLQEIASLEILAKNVILRDIFKVFPTEERTIIENNMTAEFTEKHIKSMEEYLINVMHEDLEINDQKNQNRSIYKSILRLSIPYEESELLNAKSQAEYKEALKQKMYEQLDKIPNPQRNMISLSYQSKLDCIDKCCSLSILNYVLAHEFFHIIIGIMGKDDLLDVIYDSFPWRDLGNHRIIFETLCDLFAQFFLNNSSKYDPMAGAHFNFISKPVFYEESLEDVHPSPTYRTFYQKAQRVHNKIPFNLAAMLNQSQ